MDPIFQAWARPRPHGCNLGPTRPDPARNKENNFGPSPASPEREIKISALARPGPKRSTKFWPGLSPIHFFLSAFGPDRLILSDFKTGPFSWLHIK